jgi:hypothetical protein
MSLVAHYKLDGDATDVTGTYNGTATDVTYTTGATPKTGQAGVFNGSTSLVDLGNASGISNLTTFTLSAWVFADSLTTGGTFPHIIAQRNATTARVQFLFDVGPLTLSLAGYALRSTFTPTLSQWYHVATTWDNTTGNAAIYVDGVSVAAGTTAGRLSAPSTTPWAIGNRVGGGREFDGLIDDARIYDNALTAAEVLALYNSYFATGRLSLTGNLDGGFNGGFQ